MSDIQEVRVPDIGDFKEVEVIEILVKPGDAIVAEQSVVTLESDKATMEIPAPGAGVIFAATIARGRWRPPDSAALPAARLRSVADKLPRRTTARTPIS